jgi:hypothetical protein
MILKDTWQLIGVVLKSLVILRPYRQAMKRQRADEAKTSSPHTRHFGLRRRQRSDPATSIH